jgi:hypothetical protein
MLYWPAAVAADGAGVASCPQRAQNHDMAIADFALKFGLAFNLSRGRLAQTVGVDKSVVSRWASGVQVPSDQRGRSSADFIISIAGYGFQSGQRLGSKSP